MHARMKYGKNLLEGVRRCERLSVRSLAYDPDAPGVEGAWKITLENLGKIFEFCKTREIPVVVCVFPFTFQFDDVDALSEPQRRVCQFAREHEVPVLDLLPVLAQRLEEQRAKPEDYFVDADHPSPRGNEVISKAMADFIERENVLPGSRHRMASVE
jgi:hypothetical protein